MEDRRRDPGSSGQPGRAPGPERPGDGVLREGGEEPDDKPSGPAFSVDAERRVVTLAGRPVAGVSVHPGRVRIEVRALEGSLELALRGPFRVGSRGEPLSPSDPTSLSPLLAWIGRAAERVEVDAGRRLTLRLEEGATLVAEAGFGGEGWEVQGSGDLEAVPAFLG